MIIGKKRRPKNGNGRVASYLGSAYSGRRCVARELPQPSGASTLFT